ncbi:S-layer homology domain-containing protein [Sporosarcina sp. BP05]|uniref:S-layer homology domain-containing protein n=1 Tax=Sporosarcina sp. BP05 TaxID=2758726 RepID=UPI001646A3D9|nr:S-layer homology domain-containing protein [Sporosarcina sp. BP05]
MKKIIVLFLATILVFTGSNVTVKAKGFSDVTNTHPFYEHMVYSFDQGIIQGYSNNRFIPDKNVTRGEAIIMIARTLGLNMQKRKTVFSDVGSSTAASGAIQSAYEKGIITSNTGGKFNPNEPVKRSDMAIFLANAFSMVDEEVVPFNDVTISSDAYSAIRKVIAAGVTQGHTDGTFKPNKLVTRSDFAGFLARAKNDKFRLKVKVCGLDSTKRENPSRQTMNCLITKAARQSQFSIPPEIVKAVATVESNWKQFDVKGEPIITADGGIGLMQITNTAGYDVERLKYDVQYNIETGIKFLVNNFNNSNLPKVGDHNPENLESWYFAVMAYNGIKAVNSPFYQATGESNPTAYQEKVFQELSKNGMLATKIQSIGMTKTDFNYGADTNHTIEFKKKSFSLTEKATTSKELLKVGDVITYTGSGIRLQPNTQNNKPLPTTSTDKMKIIGSPIADNQSNSSNQFVWYPVQTVQNGKTISGFIASPYISRN